jgi:effector-binding domain-containing protein
MREFFAAEIEASTCIVCRGSCSTRDVGQKINELFSELVQKAGEAMMIGAPRIYYTKWEPDSVEIEAAIPIEAGEILQNVEVKKYPACTAFNTTHSGSYEGLAQTWLELWAEAQKRGMEGSGPPWDEYVVGPSEDANPANWVTELYIPIKV